MGKVNIDQKKCIGCGLCARDCFQNVIEIVNQKAEVSEIKEKCIECGHCIAICPMNAVTLDEYDMSDIILFSDDNFEIDPNKFLNHLKLRRSIRNFTNTRVPVEILYKIIEAGRFSPTGGNRQNVTYTIVQNEFEIVKKLVFEELNEMGMESLKKRIEGKRYHEIFIKMYQDFINANVDSLFFNAGTLIAVSSNSSEAAMIAAAHMETMVYALGYGMLYSGLTVSAIAHSKKLQGYFINHYNYKVHAVLVIGEPNVRYFRSVPRKEADIIWK